VLVVEEEEVDKWKKESIMDDEIQQSKE